MDEAGAETTVGDRQILPALAPRPDVQGLRALAVCVVIVGHAHIAGFTGGYVGVDVFFVVSGYLISTLLLREATSTGHVRVGAFYARRARRILPAAGLVLAVTSVFAAIELPLSRVPAIVGDARWAAFFLANVHFSQIGTDYFQQDRATSPVQHTWSLAVEEQFYLVWPLALLLVFWLFARRRLLVTRIVVLAAWSASLVWSVVLTESSPVAAYFSSATRAWELATGALLALAGHQLSRLPAWARHVLAVVGLAAIAAAVGWYDESTAFPGWHAALPVAGAAALLAAGAAGTVGAARVLTLKPVRYVGDISYSLYLWHWPVLIMGVFLIGHQPERAADHGADRDHRRPLGAGLPPRREPHPAPAPAGARRPARTRVVAGGPRPRPGRQRRGGQLCPAPFRLPVPDGREGEAGPSARRAPHARHQRTGRVSSSPIRTWAD